MKKHYILAFFPPVLLFWLASLLGHPVADFGVMLANAMMIKESLVPYKDFYLPLTPMSSYTQVWLQHILFFLSPITVSIIWKASTYSILSVISLLYVKNLIAKLKDQTFDFPKPFIYLYPIVFMFLGPIHETHFGYTPDVIFFACLGVLLISFPHRNATEGRKSFHTLALSYLGYFLIGLSFGYKQEIGTLAIFAGFFYIVGRYIIYGYKNNKYNFMRDLFIPVFLLILPAVSLFLFYWQQDALGLMVNNIFIIPAEVKVSLSHIVKELLTLGTSSLTKLPLRLFIFCTVLLILVIIDKRRVNDTIALLSFGNPIILIKAIKWLLILFCIIITIILLVSPNYNINHWFNSQSPDFIDDSPIYKARVEYFYRLWYTIIVWGLAAAVYFLIAKVKELENPKQSWVLFIILPVICLFIIFDAAAVGGGFGPVRGPRMIAPLIIIFTIISFVFTIKPLNILNVKYKKIYLSFILLLLVFGAGRVNGFFSAELSSPLHRNISYSDMLKCYIDTEILDNMNKIKQLVNVDKKNNTLVYQTEILFYYFLNQTPVTFSPTHVEDYIPMKYYDDIELSRIKNSNITFVVTHASHKRIDSFLFRNEDPIRDYIESNYSLLYNGKYYNLWKYYKS